jgi:hypothetical protein
MKNILRLIAMAMLFNLSPSVTFVIKAQVAPIGSAAQAAQTNTLTAFTAAAGTNRVLIVTASDPLATDITAVVFNGSPMTERAQRTDGTAVDAIYTLSMGTSASTTTGNIVITSNNVSNTGKFITARVFEKVDQTTPLTGIQMANNTSAPVSSSLNITSAAGDLVFDIFDTWIDPAGGTRTVGAGQTIMHNISAIDLGDGNGFAYYGTSTEPGALSVTMSWTSTHFAVIQIAANIRGAIVLPVTLLSFNAILQQTDILLRWKVTDAVNFSHFEIERGTNGTNFISSGSRQPLTGPGDHQYEFTDPGATSTYPAGSKIYYRLKMVDLDGKYSYSKIVQVSPGKGNGAFANLQSNPFTNKISIGFDMKESGVVNLRLSDMSGKIISNKQLLIDKGFSTQSIENLENLGRGMYSLQLQSGSEVMMVKVMKL